MADPEFSWLTASREELVRLARDGSEETRVLALRYLWDHIDMGSWPEPETREVMQEILDMLGRKVPISVVEDLLRCVSRAGDMPGLDRQPLLNAMVEARLRRSDYIEALYACGPRYWPLITWYRGDEDPTVRAVVERLLPIAAPPAREHGRDEPWWRRWLGR